MTKPANKRGGRPRKRRCPKCGKNRRWQTHPSAHPRHRWKMTDEFGLICQRCFDQLPPEER